MTKELKTSQYIKANEAIYINGDKFVVKSVDSQEQYEDNYNGTCRTCGQYHSYKMSGYKYLLKVTPFSEVYPEVIC